MSLLAKIAASLDVPQVDVDVPEWGCTLRLRRFGPLTALRVAAACEAMPEGPERLWHQAAYFIQAAARDPETGASVFAGDAGLAVLHDRSTEVILRLYGAVLDLFPAATAGGEAEPGKGERPSSGPPSSPAASPAPSV